jgi:RNA polymerase sigma-70 factor (sigma-E family)
VSLFQRGDQASYEAFVSRQYESLRRFAIMMAGSRPDGEDALQEALLSVGKGWGRVREDTAEAYVRTAIARKVVDLHRRRRHVPVAAAPLPGLEVDFLKAEGDRQFFSLLHRLPVRQRAAVVLRFYLDLSDAEAAQTLGCSASTIRSNVHRGIATLRETLERPASPLPHDRIRN